MRLLPLLLSLGLVTGLPVRAQHTPEDPPKTTKTKSPVVPPMATEKGGFGTEKSVKAEKGVKTSKASFEAPPPEPPRLEPRPPVRRKAPAEVPLRISDAEIRANRLLEENARLQQEIARRQGYSLAPVQTPDQALAELLGGNERFVAGKRVRSLLTSQDPELRDQLAKGQNPFAVIVTCSDSRLADNLLFDQELGRLFTIREAGNSPDLQGIASVEYALEHLGSKLVLVLGHTACGAIKAVAEAHGKPLPGNLWAIQAAMAGLLETTHEDPNEPASVHLTHLSENNARRQSQALLDRSEIVRHLVSTGKVKVVPALYDLQTGRVKVLEMARSAAPTGH
jgi:carbonic anhydrase